jgi:hypothetical protein|tara:strand:- start:555 stop:704 length:150 start_codon:yes stop_codon:yes gene_type:complete
MLIGYARVSIEEQDLALQMDGFYKSAAEDLPDGLPREVAQCLGVAVPTL